MLRDLKLVPETSGAPPQRDVREGEELTRHKVARMRRHEVEKASFRFGVGEGLQCVDMDRGDAHGTMIRAAFSDSSSARQGPAGRTLVGKPLRDRLATMQRHTT